MERRRLTGDKASRIFRTNDLDYASVEYGRKIALIMVNGVIRACMKCYLLQNAADCQALLKSLTHKKFTLVV